MARRAPTLNLPVSRGGSQLPTGIAEPVASGPLPLGSTGIGTQRFPQMMQAAEAVVEPLVEAEEKSKVQEFQKMIIDRAPQSLQEMVDEIKTKNPQLGDSYQRHLDGLKPFYEDPTKTPEQLQEMTASTIGLYIGQIQEQEYAGQSAGQGFDDKVGTAQKTGVISAKDALSLGRPSRTTLTGQALTEEQKQKLEAARDIMVRRRERLGRDLSKQEINEIFDDVNLEVNLLANKAVREFLGSGVSSASGETTKAVDAANAVEERDFFHKPQTGETPEGEKVIPKAARKETDELQKDYDAQLKAADYGTIAVRSKQIRNLLARGTQASDIGAIYAFIKLIDPPSVVRESEVGLVNNIGSVYDKFKQKWLSATGESFMDDRVRLEFWDAAKTILDVYNDYYATINKDFQGRAKTRGVDKFMSFKDVHIDSGDLEIPGVKVDKPRAKIVPRQPLEAPAKTPTRRSSDAEIDAFLKANGKKTTPENRAALRKRLPR